MTDNVVRLFDHDPAIEAKCSAIYGLLYEQCQGIPLAVIIGMLDILKMEIMMSSGEE